MTEPVTPDQKPDNKPAPPKGPQPTQIPEARQVTLKRLNDEGRSLLGQLGTERAKYVNIENRLLQQIDQQSKAFEQAAMDIAKDLGLDTQSTSWQLDFASMTLIPKKK